MDKMGDKKEPFFKELLALIDRYENPLDGKNIRIINVDVSFPGEGEYWYNGKEFLKKSPQCSTNVYAENDDLSDLRSMANQECTCPEDGESDCISCQARDAINKQSEDLRAEQAYFRKMKKKDSGH
jgi:hypothetical protein